jgi:GT2 family glycosyltransferase
MITIIYSTHKDEVYNNNFQNHLIRSVGLNDVQILQYQNNNQYSLSELYNKGINESIHNIVVCLHNDVKLENNWGKKLIKDFQDNNDYGIIGKAGTSYFPESGVYWERLKTTMVGQVYHHPPTQKKFLSKYSAKLPYLIPVVSVDGLFISFDKTKIKHNFDENIGRFHFYDHPFCLSNYLDGVKIGITSSFDITHESVGKPNEEFFSSKEIFLNKFKKHLPLDLRPDKVFFEEIKSKPTKNLGKVAVVIPTKGKLDLLLPCLDSFRDKTSNVDYEIFVADTGSSDEEKNTIKDYIIKNSDKIIINFLEYDYYNFAKINNDVVKNYVSDKFEFILFSNNDIKLLNNVVFGMVQNFKNSPKVGTVGARLHFEDNTVQHDGILAAVVNNNTEVALTHRGLRSYYNFTRTTSKVIGNTAGLMMIRKKLFDSIGGFNEKYRVCFEDVELNFECVSRGFENIYDGRLVAYHYESQTRKNDREDIRIMVEDMKNILLDFTMKNINKLSPLFTSFS